MKNANKKDEGAKKKNQRQSAITTLSTLAGKDVDTMTDAQLRKFVGAVGKLLDLLDDKNKVKPVI